MKGKAMLSTQNTTDLGYTQLGPSEGRNIWIVHGIMGSRQNWSRFARHLSKSMPDRSITTIDLRCHGDSPHIGGPHSIQTCVNDLVALTQRLGEPQTLIGHSFGGKVALQYAAYLSQNSLSNALECVWTLDSPLAADLRPGHGEVARVIEACGQIDMPQASRQDVIQYFTNAGFSLGIAQWMTTNLRRVNREKYPQGGFQWKFDLDGIKELITDYWRVDGWSLLDQIDPKIDVNLLRAERGLRWTQDDAERISRQHPHIKTPLLKDSGHWVHIEQLESLITLMGDL